MGEEMAKEMADEMIDEQGDRSWMDTESDSEETQDIAAIRNYAYEAFDRLDKDGNGFIESTELHLARLDPSLSTKEKSFIAFLLNNQEAIAGMVVEDNPGPRLGISRDDLESYFGLISRLLG
ncbi:hypothetical protein KBI23_17205 [bacterium]|nr:hypothetical protein [bacterium]MBP9808697.1 hypothetical protein [bacterium]